MQIRVFLQFCNDHSLPPFAHSVVFFFIYRTIIHAGKLSRAFTDEAFGVLPVKKIPPPSQQPTIHILIVCHVHHLFLFQLLFIYWVVIIHRLNAYMSKDLWHRLSGRSGDCSCPGGGRSLQGCRGHSNQGCGGSLRTGHGPTVLDGGGWYTVPWWWCHRPVVRSYRLVPTARGGLAWDRPCRQGGAPRSGRSSRGAGCGGSRHPVGGWPQCPLCDISELQLLRIEERVFFLSHYSWHTYFRCPVHKTVR